MRNILKGFLESRAETYILPEAGEIHFEEGISEFIPPSLDEEALPPEAEPAPHEMDLTVGGEESEPDCPRRPCRARRRGRGRRWRGRAGLARLGFGLVWRGELKKTISPTEIKS